MQQQTQDKIPIITKTTLVLNLLPSFLIIFIALQVITHKKLNTERT